jgi:hypothetical protein
MADFIGDIVGSVFGGGDEPPPPPDPYATATAQYGMNADTARVNAALDRYKQITPYGTLDWSNVGDKWTQTTNLTPEGQYLLDAANKMSKQYAGLSDTLFGNASKDLSVPVPQANAQTRQAVEDALYRRHTSRLDPQYLQQKDKLEATLANQGITVGSDAYDTMQENYAMDKNDAYAAARDAAITGAGNAEQQQLTIQETARNQVLNELNALRSGSQVTNPTYTPQQTATNVAPTNLMQGVYNSYAGDLNNYNAGVGSSNAMLSGLTSLGANYAGSAAGSTAITSGLSALASMF